MAYIDQDTFIEIWNASASVQECADRLGIAYGTASNRATRLRNRGLPAKRMPQPRHRPTRYTYDELEAAMRRGSRKLSPLERLWSYIEKRGPDECWLWTGTLGGANHTGFQYGTFAVSVNKRSLNFKPHRLVWALDRRESPKGKVIRHTCDVPLCCNPRHLVRGTQVDNVWDKVRADRQRRGMSVNTARLTPADVRAIRASNLPHIALARRYGCCGSHIIRIRRGDAWKSVQ